MNCRWGCSGSGSIPSGGWKPQNLLPGLFDEPYGWCLIEKMSNWYPWQVENWKTCLSLSSLPSFFFTCSSISQIIVERKVHFKPDRVPHIESSEDSLFTGESKLERTKNLDVMQSEDWRSLSRRVRMSSWMAIWISESESSLTTSCLNASHLSTTVGQGCTGNEFDSPDAADESVIRRANTKRRESVRM